MYLFESLQAQIGILVVLLAGSAFFSMSETAITSTDPVQIRGRAEHGDRRARRLLKLLEHPEKVLTTVLVGNNLVNIGASVLSGLVATQLLGALGPAVAVGVMTFFILVFAEITPKTLAVHHSEAISMRVALPLRIIQLSLTPFVWFFSLMARVILAALGVRNLEKDPFVVTQAQIENLVRVGAAEGEVEHFEHKVITEVFDFTETPVRRVVTPTSEVHHLPKEARLMEALEISRQTGHSRIPIIDGDFDHVLGFVHAKDLLQFNDEALLNEPVTDAVRAVLIAHHSTPADRVLARMQRERKLMAIIQDDDGHSIGIATVEDLLEELVGEIHDEFDEDPSKASNREHGASAT